MRAVMAVYEGRSSLNLLFESMRDARSFEAFCRLFMEECFTANAYVVRAEPRRAFFRSGKGMLREDLVISMAKRLWCNRLALPADQPLPYYCPEFSTRNNSILFSFYEEGLPPRIKPTIGDRVRILGPDPNLRRYAFVQEVYHDGVWASEAMYYEQGRSYGFSLSWSQVMKVHNPYRKAG